MAKLNEIVFWKEIVDGLICKRNKLFKSLKQTNKNEYFDFYKENPLCDWGRVCLAIKEAETRLQNLYDSFDSEVLK